MASITLDWIKPILVLLNQSYVLGFLTARRSTQVIGFARISLISLIISWILRTLNANWFELTEKLYHNKALHGSSIITTQKNVK